MRPVLFVTLFFALIGCGPTIGDPCTSATDCGGAVCLNRDFTPGGSCSLACELGVANTCPTGSTCVKHALGNGAPGCMRVCLNQSSCRNGYLCKSANDSVPVCVGPQGI